MKLYQVDAFTNTPFRGNPAGVCILDRFPDAKTMQALAAEMNLSETAFIEKRPGAFNIRYFTPTCEVPLCGHATLAGAHMLHELGLIAPAAEITFKANASDLQVTVENGWIKMVFPAYELTQTDNLVLIDRVLGVSAMEAWVSQNGWLLVRLGTEKEVLDAAPDFEAISREDFPALIAVSALADAPDCDFVVRVFCNPKYGITEDPVTGAANCILAPYWHKELRKTGLVSRQLSARSGQMRVNLVGDKVEIMGQAVTVFEIDMVEDNLGGHI